MPVNLAISLRKIKKFIIKNKFLSKFDQVLRIIIGKFIILSSRLNKNQLISNKKFIILSVGGLGDGLFHAELIDAILKNNYELVFFVNEDYKNIFDELYINENIIIVGYNASNIYNLASKYKDYFYISTNATLESYLFYIFLGSKNIFGYIGDYKKIRSNFSLHKNSFIESTNKRIRISNLKKSLELNNLIDLYVPKSKTREFANGDFIVISFLKSHKWGDVGNLSVELQAEIVDIIRSKHPLQNLIYVGVTQQFDLVEKVRKLALKKYNRTFENLCGKLTSKELIEYIKLSKLILSIDGGILHLSHFYSKKTIAFFNFSDVKTYSPPGAIIIKSSAECAPCKEENNLPLDGYPISCPYKIKCSFEYKKDEIIRIIENA